LNAEIKEVKKTERGVTFKARGGTRTKIQKKGEVRPFDKRKKKGPLSERKGKRTVKWTGGIFFPKGEGSWESGQGGGGAPQKKKSSFTERREKRCV